jgi:hypothetical protein
MGVAFAQSQQPPVQSQAPSSQKTQQVTPDQSVTEKLPLTIKIVPAEDAGKQSAEGEHNRAEKAEIDKKVAFETQRIADYTFAVAVFTLLVFAGTGLLGLATFITARAAKLSAEAVINAERPHMIMDELKISGLKSPQVNGSIPSLFFFKIQNFGRTPSFAKELALQFHFDKKLPEGVTLLKMTEIVGVTAPGRTYGVDWPNEHALPADKFKLVVAGATNIFVIGCFKYTDVFERPHESHFAYQLEIDAGADSSKHFSPAGGKSYWKYT